MKTRVHSEELKQETYKGLEERGISIDSMAEIVYTLQAPYAPELTMETCRDSVHAVLRKREVQHAVLVAVELDKLAEAKALSPVLQRIVETDEGLFGVDETIALGAVNINGSIAVTTFGFLDKAKIGIIKELDTKREDGKVNTFMDDIVCAICANASGRIAHRMRDEEEQKESMVAELDKIRENFKEHIHPYEPLVANPLYEASSCNLSELSLTEEKA